MDEKISMRDEVQWVERERERVFVWGEVSVNEMGISGPEKESGCVLQRMRDFKVRKCVNERKRERHGEKGEISNSKRVPKKRDIERER